MKIILNQQLTVAGVFQDLHERDLLPDNKSSSIAWISSIQACLLIGVDIFPGPLHHHGYLPTLVLVRSVLVAFDMLMTGLCSQY